jgi:hypothetical protein
MDIKKSSIIPQQPNQSPKGIYYMKDISDERYLNMDFGLVVEELLTTP